MGIDIQSMKWQDAEKPMSALCRRCRGDGILFGKNKNVFTADKDEVPFFFVFLPHSHRPWHCHMKFLP